MTWLLDGEKILKISLVVRIGAFKPRLGLFKRFKRLREYPILKPILG